MNKAEKKKYQQIIEKVQKGLHYVPTINLQTENEVLRDKAKHYEQWLDIIEKEILEHLQIYDEE